MDNGLSSFETKPLTYGGFGERLLAKIIDGIIIGVVNFVIGLAIGKAMGEAGPGSPAQIVGMLVGIVLQFGYNAYFLSSAKMATPGKQVFNLKVTDLAGGRISFGKALGRSFAEILSSLILLIGYIMAAFDSKKQALHDKIVGTYVVKG